MKRVYLIFFSILWLGCQKENASLPQNDIETAGRKPAPPPPSSGFQLTAFSVSNGQPYKWGGCSYATVDISWTSTGESLIQNYEIQKSESSSMASATVVSVYAAGSSDASISRTHNEIIAATGIQKSFYYRLKMAHKNGTVSYSEARAVSVRSRACTPGGWQ